MREQTESAPTLRTISIERDEVAHRTALVACKRTLPLFIPLPLYVCSRTREGLAAVLGGAAVCAGLFVAPPAYANHFLGGIVPRASRKPLNDSSITLSPCLSSSSPPFLDLFFPP